MSMNMMGPRSAYPEGESARRLEAERRRSNVPLLALPIVLPVWAIAWTVRKAWRLVRRK